MTSADGARVHTSLCARIFILRLVSITMAALAPLLLAHGVPTVSMQRPPTDSTSSLTRAPVKGAGIRCKRCPRRFGRPGRRQSPRRWPREAERW